MGKNLLIVESPAKAKTIEKILGKDFTVKSSYGHVRDLEKKNMGIDIDNGYLPTYKVSDDKKKVVSELKKFAKGAEVWLATDEDREGEAISWHLLKVLGLDEKKTKRIVFHEITPTAIKKAVANPRTVDINLVNAQQARRVLDRLVGFELSPVLWKKVKAGLSAGRVQSVAVKLLVEREREIINFNTDAYFKVSAEFKVDKANLKADLGKKFKTEAEAQDFLEACAQSIFAVHDIQVKPGKRTPAAPFTTSTLQQEASRKLGFSVARTMSVAQRLYENGHITYMRTDSVNLSQTALNGAKSVILKEFGENYLKIRKYKNKASNAQEAHEAIRPTYLENTRIDAERDQQRLYELIWKRTVASQMEDAQLERTTIKIDVSQRKELFQAKGEVVKFDGFLKLYIESKDDDENDEQMEGLLPPVKVGQQLVNKWISATERFTSPPYRFAEASLVKKLEELGIGRPSTYAPTIQTIQNRGYVEKTTRDGKDRNYIQLHLENGSIDKSNLTENYGTIRNKLVPTDLGTVVTDFLNQHFERIMDYSFTANIENEFDEIASGEQDWVELLDTIYKPFHKTVEETTEHAERASGERILGIDPKSGRKILVRIGRYGPIAQIGTSEDEQPLVFASLLPGQHLENITLEEALDLFKLPKDLGQYKGETVQVNIGRFGPYVKFGAKYISLDKGEDPHETKMERAIELIDAKLKEDAPIAQYEGLDVTKGVGRFGAFIKWNDLFINVNKKYDFDNLSQADVEELIEAKKKKEREKVVKVFENEGIRVEKSRWKRFKVIKGKTSVEIPKESDIENMKAEDAVKIIESAASKKKATKRKTTTKKK